MAESSAVLRDGSRVSGQAEAVARAVSIDDHTAQREREWIAGLRAQGVKAAHPDDGWVDRERNLVHLAYPQFNDGLGVGDLLALGWSDDRMRIVRVMGTSENPFAVDHAGPWYHHFEVVSDA